MKEIQRLAIVSDIHANKYALEIFLNYVDTEFPVDKILNLGDSVNIGPHPKEVVSNILNDSRFISILGNNDESMWGVFPSKITKNEKAHTLWTREQIGEDLLHDFHELPKSVSLELKYKSLFLIHSRVLPHNNTDLPLLYRKKTINDFIDDYPKQADYIFFGHTHDQILISSKSRKILNPGSLGCSKNIGFISFSIIEIKNDQWNIEFHNIPYSLQPLIDDFNELDVPDKENLLKTFYNT
jgi:putative phosphoesterase